MSRKEKGSLEERREHRGLRTLLAEFSWALKAPAEPREIERRFTELHGTIRTHFAFEEEGGYFEGVLSDAPWLDREVRALHNQHIAFLEDLLEIEGLVAARKARRTWNDVQTPFRRLRRRLEEHENRENRLTQRSVMRDLGAAD